MLVIMTSYNINKDGRTTGPVDRAGEKVPVLTRERLEGDGHCVGLVVVTVWFI